MNEMQIQALRAQREARRLRRKRRERSLLLLFALAAILVVVLVEVGRAFSLMLEVNRFVSTLAAKSSAEVKEELERLSPALVDHNPMVRNAPMVAFRLATGLRLEGGPEWYAWWQSNKHTWVYLPPSATGSTEVVSPHPYKQAFPPKP